MNELNPKHFSFSFTDSDYPEKPSTTRRLSIELDENVTYSEVVEEFLHFLSGCWGYTITLEDIVRKRGQEINPLSSFPGVLDDESST
jgi:predicted component of type VI protein secretion system